MASSSSVLQPLESKQATTAFPDLEKKKLIQSVQIIEEEILDLRETIFSTIDCGVADTLNRENFLPYFTYGYKIPEEYQQYAGSCDLRKNYYHRDGFPLWLSASEVAKILHSKKSIEALQQELTALQSFLLEMKVIPPKYYKSYTQGAAQQRIYAEETAKQWLVFEERLKQFICSQIPILHIKNISALSAIKDLSEDNFQLVSPQYIGFFGGWRNDIEDDQRKKQRENERLKMQDDGLCERTRALRAIGGYKFSPPAAPIGYFDGLDEILARMPPGRRGEIDELQQTDLQSSTACMPSAMPVSENKVAQNNPVPLNKSNPQSRDDDLDYDIIDHREMKDELQQTDFQSSTACMLSVMPVSENKVAQNNLVPPISKSNPQSRDDDINHVEEEEEEQDDFIIIPASVNNCRK